MAGSGFRCSKEGQPEITVIKIVGYRRSVMNANETVEGAAFITEPIMWQVFECCEVWREPLPKGREA